jgi:predicted HicB family RNase H-like nuclease
MKYKSYTAIVTFDDEAEIFHGEVQDLRDVITFQGQSVAELRREFKASVDDYLAWCKERGKSPEKPFSGQVLLRTEPCLHRILAQTAAAAGQSLNAWAVEKLRSAVQTPPARA